MQIFPQESSELSYARQNKLNIKLLTGIFGFFFAVYLLVTSARLFSVDDKIMFDVTKSILTSGSFASSEPLSERDYFVEPWFYVEGKDGRAYGKYGLGQSLAILPLFALGEALLPFIPNSYSYWFPFDYIPFKSPNRISEAERKENTVIPGFTSLLNPAATALSCLLVFLFAYYMGRSLASSLTVAGIFGFATAAFPYAKYSFQHPLVSVLMLASLYYLFRYSAKGGSWRMVASGACLGFAAITRYETVASLIVLLPYALWGSYQNVRKGYVPAKASTPRCETWSGGFSWKPFSQSGLTQLSSFVGQAWRSMLGVVPFIVPVLLAEAVVLWFNYLRFGNPFTAGYFQEGFTTDLVEGAKGLLLTPGRSLILFSPPILAGFLCLPWLIRRRLPEGLAFAALIMIYFVLYAKWSGWEGGWAWGSRYPLPLLPYLILPTVVALQARSVWPKAMAIGLSAVGLPIQLLGVATNFNDFYMERTIIKGQDFWPTVFVWDLSQIPGHLDLLSRGAIDLWFVNLFRYNAPLGLKALVLVPIGLLVISCLSIGSELKSTSRSGTKEQRAVLET